MASSAGDKTEKATPKRRDEARKEGQVARSMEVSSALAMLAGFSVMIFWGPRIWESMAHEMVLWLERIQDPDVTASSVMNLFVDVVKTISIAIAPFFAAMLFTGVAANVIQIKFRVTPGAIKPKFSRMNPINGFKQKFSWPALVELAKNILKLIVVGVPAAFILYQYRFDLMALGDAEPVIAGLLAIKLITKIGLTVAAIYIGIAILDYIWQRYQFEKGIRMTKNEVKQEARQQDVAPEMKAAQRRRQREAARRRMLSDVPQADVIITNPTHYSIALKYDAELGAPQVLAKGVDLLALRIREIAEEAGVMRVENRPLARELYARVEVGTFIPGDMFSAVAEVLAYVYRMENRRPGEGDQQSQRAEVA